ncbi:Nn.00g038450.m01.CDS01 [Neocucurbitaria sp. VM-36]
MASGWGRIGVLSSHIGPSDKRRISRWLAVMQAMLGKAATLVREPWSQVSIHDMAFLMAPLLCGLVGLRGLLAVVDVAGRTVTVSGALRDAQHQPLRPGFSANDNIPKQILGHGGQRYSSRCRGVAV